MLLFKTESMVLKIPLSKILLLTPERENLLKFGEIFKIKARNKSETSERDALLNEKSSSWFKVTSRTRDLGENW